MSGVAACCALGSALAVASGVFLMPPPELKAPEKTGVFGRFTFLTFQSNVLCAAYHALRFAAPAHYVAMHAWPLAFALGAGLTVTYRRYYGLDHFVAAKRAEDLEWRGRGWRWIPLANHLEHGLALPLALLSAARGGHAGETSGDDVVRFVGGYVAFYLCLALANKKLTSVWVYPIFDEAEARVGAAAFPLIALPVSATYLALGFLGTFLTGAAPVPAGS